MSADNAGIGVFGFSSKSLREVQILGCHRHHPRRARRVMCLLLANPLPMDARPARSDPAVVDDLQETLVGDAGAAREAQRFTHDQRIRNGEKVADDLGCGTRAQGADVKAMLGHGFEGRPGALERIGAPPTKNVSLPSRAATSPPPVMGASSTCTPLASPWRASSRLTSADTVL